MNFNKKYRLSLRKTGLPRKVLSVDNVVYEKKKMFIDIILRYSFSITSLYATCTVTYENYKKYIYI